MQAVTFSRYGGPEVLELAEVADPVAGAGRIRVRVLAAGVNFYDAKVRSGLFSGGREPAHPLVPGLEAAGIVDQVGPGVTGTAVGEAVFGLATGGAAAGLAVLTAWAPQPATLSPVQAGGLAVVAETAVRCLDLLDVGPGDRLLVHGAAGGVGQAAVQLAGLRGALVVGTARPANHPLLARYGALATSYGEGMPGRVRELFGSPTHVLDTAGTQLDDLLALAPAPERVVSIANFAAGEHGARVTSGGGDAAAALAEVAELAATGRFSLEVAATFGFEQAAQAHRLVESRTVAGKIVLVA
ncbi:MAG: zinc-binding dehydrogenase [Propionicimonas sp.]|nr:zinc-binding dehydrogenase [Propionicimonas sp.]